MWRKGLELQRTNSVGCRTILPPQEWSSLHRRQEPPEAPTSPAGEANRRNAGGLPRRESSPCGCGERRQERNPAMAIRQKPREEANALRFRGELDKNPDLEMQQPGPRPCCPNLP